MQQKKTHTFVRSNSLYWFILLCFLLCCTVGGISEQKARATYEKLIDLCKDDPDVVEVLRFLREREIVHFQRFGEALRGVQDKLARKNFYMNECKMEMPKFECTNAFNGVNNYNPCDSKCKCNN